MTAPFAIPTLSDMGSPVFTREPDVPLERRIDTFLAMLRIMAAPSPFAVANAFYSCGLSVSEVGASRYEALVDEAMANRGNA